MISDGFMLVISYQFMSKDTDGLLMMNDQADHY